MIQEMTHAGNVISRTHATCLVADPIVFLIDGRKIELSLSDATILQQGLSEAVDRVSSSDRKLKGDDANYNLLILAKGCSGMSFPTTRLG